ncbi:hypothetical protein G3I76_03365, partial [Streptomyces sp. SID11233]|nr:hypothetical protein [Streptomyces sp. SID11233]
TQQAKKTGNPVHKQAQAKAAPKASSAVSLHKKPASNGGAKSGGSSGGSSRSKGGSSGDTDAGKACSVNNSFTPGTRVLMADGTTKAIKDVKVGDKVVATNPETGSRTVETVTAEIK